jgi:hypothetical protein
VWDAITAIAAVLGLLIAGATAWFGWQAIESARRDSRDRTRPYVIADMGIAPGSQSVMLRVRNVGQSVARNVSVTFTPDLPGPESADPGVLTPSLRRRYLRPVTMIAPGQALSNVWWTGQSVPGSQEMINAEPLPDGVTVVVAYVDDRGTTYSDMFALSAETMYLEGVSVSSTSIRGRLESIARETRRIADSAQSIAPTRSIRRDGRALRVQLTDVGDEV